MGVGESCKIDQAEIDLEGEGSSDFFKKEHSLAGPQFIAIIAADMRRTMRKRETTSRLAELFASQCARINRVNEDTDYESD